MGKEGYSMKNKTLMPLLEHVFSIAGKFSDIWFSHVYMTSNSYTDNLSKQVVVGSQGMLQVKEHSGGQDPPNDI